MESSDGAVLRPTASERWLSLEEIAQHLGMSKVTIYKWVVDERIPGHKVGRNWKFKVSEVDAWVVRGGKFRKFKATEIDKRIRDEEANQHD